MSFNLRKTKKASRTRKSKGGKGSSRRKNSAAKKIQSKTRKHLAKKKSGNKITNQSAHVKS